MHSESDRARIDDARVPRLAAGWERKGRSMSPEEAFLLSRVDGSTPWTLLREIGGLPPKQVDRCLERWLVEGILEVPRAAKESRGDGGTREEASGLDPSLERWVDPHLDVPESLQRRVLAADAALDRPYHELLGVPRDADAKAIKRAYFSLSKEFHPDRYFRREIGDFKPRFERVFKKIVEAYELMSDPITRAEIERTLPPEALRSEAAGGEEGAESGPAMRRRRREMLERLRRQFRLPEKLLAERRVQARNFSAASRVAAAKERWLEAAASARLAIAFDPAESDYKRAFAEIQGQVHCIRAGELQEKAEAALEAHAAHEALRLYEEVLHYQPGDAEAHSRAAIAALEADEVDRALEYAEHACELEPDQAGHHVSRARVLRRQRLREGAREALDTALRLDPRHREAREEMSALRRLGRRR